MTDTNQMGGPAFPIPATDTHDTWPGMTLRDWFAGQALAMLADPNIKGPEVRFAEIAYRIADAMIAERAK